MNKLDQIDITKFLPHRAPFLMVDKVLSLSEDYVETSFLIKKDCIFIDDSHLNEVGLIENAAQTCSAIVGRGFFKDDDIEGEGTKLIGFISAIKKVTIVSCPKINTLVVSKAKLKSRFDTEHYSLCTLNCNIYEADKELLSCEMNLFIQELK